MGWQNSGHSMAWVINSFIMIDTLIHVMSDWALWRRDIEIVHATLTDCVTVEAVDSLYDEERHSDGAHDEVGDRVHVHGVERNVVAEERRTSPTDEITHAEDHKHVDTLGRGDADGLHEFNLGC